MTDTPEPDTMTPAITSSREHTVRAAAHLSEKDIERVVIDWLRKRCDDFTGLNPEECRAEWRESFLDDNRKAGSPVLTVYGEKRIEDKP